MLLLQALLTAKEREDPPGWQAFQQRMQTLKLQRTRAMREAENVQTALLEATDSGNVGLMFRVECIPTRPHSCRLQTQLIRV
jgi:hypothetical protein